MKAATFFAGGLSLVLTREKQKKQIKRGEITSYNLGELLFNSFSVVTVAHMLLKYRDINLCESNTKQLRKILSSRRREKNCLEECLVGDVSSYLDDVYQDKLESKIRIHGSKAKKLDDINSDTDLSRCAKLFAI